MRLCHLTLTLSLRELLGLITQAFGRRNLHQHRLALHHIAQTLLRLVLPAGVGRCHATRLRGFHVVHLSG